MKTKLSSVGSRRNASSKRPPNKSTILGASLFGAAIGCVCITALTILFSLVCFFTPNPDKLLFIFSLAINAVSFFITGYAATKKKSAAIPVGAISGTFLSCITWIASLFLDGSLSTGLPFPIDLFIRISFVIISILGALLCVNMKKKR